MDGSKYMEYWNNEGAQKNFSTPFQMKVFKLHVPVDKKVLDVGCGYGRTMRMLADEGYLNLTGAEPAEALRKRAAEENPDLSIMEFDGRTLPFEDDSFDAVVLAAVLTSIPLDADQDRLMSEISRVLVQGGLLYVNDFLLNTDDRNLERYYIYKIKYGTYGVFEIYDGGVTRHHSRQRIGSLLKNYDTLIFKTVVYTTMNGNTSNGFYYLGRLS